MAKQKVKSRLQTGSLQTLPPFATSHRAGMTQGLHCECIKNMETQETRKNMVEALEQMKLLQASLIVSLQTV